MNTKQAFSRFKFTIQVMLYLLTVMLTLMAIAGIMLVLFHWLNLFDTKSPILEFAVNTENGVVFSLQMLFVLSTTLGVAMTIFFVVVLVRPIRRIGRAMKAVAGGDYSVRLELKGIDDVKEISQDFNTMAQELASTETMRRDFVNHVSHEFKTPITSISGFAGMLRDPALGEEKRQEFVGIIAAESERLTMLATNMLNLSKYEALNIVTDKRPCQLDEMIRRAVLLFEPRWSAKQLDVALELEEITLHGSPSLLDVIWNNLLDNAIKYSLPGGAMQLRLTRQGNHVIFSIQDEGPGMDEQTQAHIFERFYQGDTSHTQQGHGLGLALVKRIVELCRGSIAVQSAPGEGSTFIVRLPVINESR